MNNIGYIQIRAVDVHAKCVTWLAKRNNQIAIKRQELVAKTMKETNWFGGYKFKTEEQAIAFLKKSPGFMESGAWWEVEITGGWWADKINSIMVAAAANFDRDMFIEIEIMEVLANS